ncbi:5-formyltetrahydrofolate cyclo-ligase [Phellopilus nigrolimitatus]|nr:5-formyltetrahydrofolate cyclo-ligase [Phellopilus nigrolimitatus]
MTSANLILNAKKALRQTVSATLRVLPDSEVQHQSELILKHVFALPIFQRSKTVSCYLSMKGEVDTSEIAREILRKGKSLYVPKIASRKDRRMDLLRVYDFGDLDSLPSGTWGIKEPDPEYDGRRRSSIFDDDAEPLDLILVPGVAFDTSLSRLGHGKGYYDFFINTYSKKKAQENSPCPQLLALSLRQQMLPLGQIPMAEHDRPMDAIVTSDGVVTGKTESPVAKLL